MAVQHTKCLNSPDVFCYICVRFTVAKQRFKITNIIERAYLAYCGVKLRDGNKELGTIHRL